MGARGRRGLIAGLEDLAKGVVLATEMRRRALADALERERFEFDKQIQDEQLKEREAYHQGLLSEKKATMSAAARKAAEERRKSLSESLQRGRVSKNLESGNLTRAARIAYNRFGETIPEGTLKLFSPPGQERETELEFFKRDPEGYGRYRAAGREPDKPVRTGKDVYRETEELAAEMGGIPAIPYNMGKASRFVRGADNLPLPETVEVEEEPEESGHAFITSLLISHGAPAPSGDQEYDWSPEGLALISALDRVKTMGERLRLLSPYMDASGKRFDPNRLSRLAELGE